MCSTLASTAITEAEKQFKAAIIYIAHTQIGGIKQHTQRLLANCKQGKRKRKKLMHCFYSVHRHTHTITLVYMM